MLSQLGGIREMEGFEVQSALTERRRRLKHDVAIRLGQHFGVAPLLIGLTVVSFGTSLPEMLVTMISGLRHIPDLAIGNQNEPNRLYTNLLRQLDAPLPLCVGDIYRLDVYARYGAQGSGDSGRRYELGPVTLAVAERKSVAFEAGIPGQRQGRCGIQSAGEKNDRPGSIHT
jgi:hypothetical protein